MIGVSACAQFIRKDRAGPGLGIRLRRFQQNIDYEMKYVKFEPRYIQRYRLRSDGRRAVWETNEHFGHGLLSISEAVSLVK